MIHNIREDLQPSFSNLEYLHPCWPKQHDKLQIKQNNKTINEIKQKYIEVTPSYLNKKWIDFLEIWYSERYMRPYSTPIKEAWYYLDLKTSIDAQYLEGKSMA